MTLEELRARAAELRTKLVSIDEESRGAALTEEKQAEWDSAEADYRKTEEAIQAIEARMERMKGLGTSETHTERSTPGAPAVHIKKDVFDLDAVRADSNGPDDYVARVKDNAQRAVEQMRYARIASKEAAQERVSELLMDYDDTNGTLAKRILVTGSPVYERAFGKAMKACSTSVLTGEEARVMQTLAANGGYAVPVQLDPTVILTNDGHVGDLRSIARVETIVGKEWQGVTSNGISVSRDGTPANANNSGPAAGEIGRQNELDQAADGSFYLGQPTIKATRVQGFVPFSIEIDQDWGGLRSEISRMLADAKDREELESFTLGDGTGSPAQPLGVVGGLSGGSLIAQLGSEGVWSDADVYNMELQLAPRWRRNARFMANRGVYSTIRQFADADGHDLWERIGNGLPSRLLGYEALENSYMQDGKGINTAANGVHKLLLFGDFQQFLIVDRVGMDVEFVPHVFGADGRPTGQRGIYAIWRNNARVLVPNAFKLLNLVTAA